MDKYNFLFSEEEANLILAGLGELPAKTTLALILIFKNNLKNKTKKKNQ